MAGQGSTKRLAGRSAVAAVSLLVVSGLLTTRPGAQIPSTDALPFSKQFLVTGNYSVGTVDLIPSNQGNGFLSGTIPMSGVPANAEVVGAYLYWETISTNVIENDGALFRGLPITVVKKTARTLESVTRALLERRRAGGWRGLHDDRLPCRRAALDAPAARLGRKAHG
jgi:hypothetical protein